MMKKFTAILLLLVSVAMLQSKAQITTCNANFTYIFTSSNTVAFTPAEPGDTLISFHNWNFGDGSAASTAKYPTHTFPGPGSYVVKHKFWRTNPNGVIVCSDTVNNVVTINPPPCNLSAYFIWQPDSTQPLKVWFNNFTAGYQPGDSVRWTFGDGTSSTLLNPSHIYAAAGSYTVCLQVKRPTPAGTTPCVSEICKQVVVTGNACVIGANFTFVRDSLNPDMVYFTNTTANLQPEDSIRWTFGDGNSSSAVNPVHIYANSGAYIVCLRIIRPTPPGAAPCVSEICKLVQVNSPCNLIPGFYAVADSVGLANTIHFINQTGNFLPTDSIRWSFGDGSPFSYAVNPSHTYAAPGVYNVCIRVWRTTTAGTTPCVREYCRQVVVLGTPCNLVPNFFAYPDSLGQPNKFYFFNSTGNFLPTDSIRWNFGDGSPLSYAINPVHTYSAPGVYNVCIRVWRTTAPGTTPCIKEYCRQIVVPPPPCTVVTSFTVKRDTVNFKKYYFTNTTAAPSGTATAQWSFGDGSSATSWNAVHEYAAPGTYIICLTIKTSSTCIRSKCDTIVVTPPAPPCNQLANFSYIKFINDNQKFSFVPAYINPALQYTWTFGDGTGTHDITTTHRYTTAGTYTACLTVFKSNNCAATSCKPITVLPQINCDSIQVSYTYQRDPFMPNKVYFYAVANFPILQQRWTITRLPASNAYPPVTLFQNNPIYIFPDTGTYRVCLRAVTLGGCIKEYCQNISITQASQCLLTAYPNPASSVVNVNVTLSTPVMINGYIYNAQNVLVKQKQQMGVAGPNVVSFSIGDLVAGFYTIKLVYGDKTCYAKFQKL